ncbi:MAG: Gfo/Idh/MocA family protein [Anaerolineales bacterium]
MRFLIAGLGSIGRRHLRNLVALGERDIVLFRTRTSTLPEADLPDLPTETELAAALGHRPDAVIVANPTAHHLSVAMPAAEAGCHLLLEKPVSHSLEGLDDLGRAARRTGSRILVGYQFRFHPGLRELRRIVEEGSLGKLILARAQWGEYLPDWHPWEDYRRSYAARADLGGGVLRTLSHPFDYLRWLLGEAEFLWGRAARSGELEIDVEDVADAALAFPSGVVATVHLDFLQRPATHSVEITGSRGSATWRADEGNVQVWNASRTEGRAIESPAGWERNDMFLAEMRHFRDVAAGAAEPECGLPDGVRALEIALQAAGKTVMKGPGR